MRDPNRIHEVMLRLEELWRRYPDWRFMQLICNMQSMTRNDMYYMEDDRLVELIDVLEERGF